MKLTDAKASRDQAQKRLSDYEKAHKPLQDLYYQWEYDFEEQGYSDDWRDDCETRLADMETKRLELKWDLSLAEERVLKAEDRHDEGRAVDEDRITNRKKNGDLIQAKSIDIGGRYWGEWYKSSKRPKVISTTHTIDGETIVRETLDQSLAHLMTKHEDPWGRTSPREKPCYWIKGLYAPERAKTSEECVEQETNFRTEAVKYYNAKAYIDSEERIRCQVLGFRDAEHVVATHIVRNGANLTEGNCQQLFGLQKSALEGPANSLLLSRQIKEWFDDFQLIIRPRGKGAFRTWQMELLESSIGRCRVVKDRYMSGGDLDNHQLRFDEHSSNRPKECFLYFHFIVSMAKLRDAEGPEWKRAWAKYTTDRPFPTPGKHLHTTMLLALASSFKPTTMYIIDRWLTADGIGWEIEEYSEDDEIEECMPARWDTAHAKFVPT